MSVDKKTAQRIAREKMLADPAKAAIDRENRRVACRRYRERRKLCGVKELRIVTTTEDERKEIQAVLADLKKKRT